MVTMAKSSFLARGLRPTIVCTIIGLFGMFSMLNPLSLKGKGSVHWYAVTDYSRRCGEEA